MWQDRSVAQNAKANFATKAPNATQTMMRFLQTALIHKDPQLESDNATKLPVERYWLHWTIFEQSSDKNSQKLPHCSRLVWRRKRRAAATLQQIRSEWGVGIGNDCNFPMGLIFVFNLCSAGLAVASDLVFESHFRNGRELRVRSSSFRCKKVAPTTDCTESSKRSKLWKRAGQNFWL